MAKKILYLVLICGVVTALIWRHHKEANNRKTEYLLRYLSSEDIQIQDIGIRELSLLGNKAVNKVLLFALNQPQSSIGRKNAIQCLGQIKTRESALALISFFKKTLDIPQLVNAALLHIGKPAVAPLITSFDSDSSLVKVLILGALNDIINKTGFNTREAREVKKGFVNAFRKDNSPAVRITALHFLVQFDNESDVKELIRSALHDRDPKIREVARGIPRNRKY
jgi:hypothetical protein